MITVREITTLDALADYKNVWNKLNSECSSGGAFTSFEWVYAWYKWYVSSGTPLVLFIYDEEKPIGFAPLYTWRGTLGKVAVQRIDFAGYNLGIGTFIVTDQIETVVSALMDFLAQRKWDTMVLKGIPKSSRQHSALSQWLGDTTYRSVVEPHEVRVINIEGTWEEYLKKFGKKLKHTFNNKRNQANKLYSTVEFKRLENIDENELESYMDKIVDIAARSWKAHTGSAIGSNAHVEGFYRQIARDFNSKGELDLSLLYFDDVPVAYLFGILYNNQYFAIDTAYLEEFQKNSPGNLVNLMLIRDLFENHCEFYVNEGYDPYKSRYIADILDTSMVFLFSKSLRSRIAYLAKFKVEPFLKKLQSNGKS